MAAKTGSEGRVEEADRRVGLLLGDSLAPGRRMSGNGRGMSCGVDWDMVTRKKDQGPDLDCLTKRRSMLAVSSSRFGFRAPSLT